MGDPVNLAARLTARAPGRGIMATADVLDRAGTVYHTETKLLPLEGQGAGGDCARRRGRHGAAPEGASGPDADRRPRRRAGRALGGHRQRTHAPAAARRDRGRARPREVALWSRSFGSKALGFQQLEIEGEHYAASEPYGALRGMLRQLVGVTGDRSREEAGGQLDPFVKGMMPDLAPWLPLLAIPFDAAVQSTPESDALDPAAARDRIHETVSTFLERILMMPTLIVVEDGHWLDDASTLPAPASLGEAGPASVARLRDDPARIPVVHHRGRPRDPD